MAKPIESAKEIIIVDDECARLTEVDIRAITQYGMSVSQAATHRWWVTQCKHRPQVSIRTISRIISHFKETGREFRVAKAGRPLLLSAVEDAELVDAIENMTKIKRQNVTAQTVVSAARGIIEHLQVPI